MGHPQRKKLFIDASVQGSLIRRVISHWLVFVVVAFVVSFILQVLTDPFRPLSAHFKDMWWTHGPFLIVVLFLLPAYVIDTIKLSHRFAGPVFRLRRAIRDVADGKTPQAIKFRKDDFWQDLAGDYNAMLTRLDVLSDNNGAVAAHTTEEQVAVGNQG
jgi:nitrogen fixation/metabolism regulation signal transduction histidine kinase